MRYLFVLAISAILFFGCEKSGQTPQDSKNKFAYDSTDIKTMPVENPNQQFKLEYKFASGTNYTYRITMLSNLDQSQKAMSDSAITNKVVQTIIYILKLSPRETDKDGVTELNAEITSAKIDMTGGGRKVTYNSDSVKTRDDMKRFADNHSLVNNPFVFRLTKYGDIADVYKVEGIVNSYLDYTGMKDSATADDKTNLKTQIIESVLKPMISQIFRKFPDKEVAKDSTWSMPQQKRQMLIFQMDQTNKFSVKQLEKLNDDRIAVLGIKMDVNIVGDTKRSEQGVNYEFTKPQISASGTVYFNVDKGYVEKIKTETLTQTSVTAEGKTPMGVQRRSSKETLKTQNFIEKI